MQVLAGFDHILYMERLKFSNLDNAAALVTSIAATNASADFASAEAKSSEALGLRMSIDPEDSYDALTTGMEAAKADEEERAFRTVAEDEVVKASGNDPLIDPKAIGRDTDRQKIAGLNAVDMQHYLLQVIEERQADTKKARAEFTEDPERIFSLEPLVQATKDTLVIDDNTIYAWIVRDYMEEQHAWHVFTAIVQTILALVLAVLVPGGGRVAAAAMIAGAGSERLPGFRGHQGISGAEGRLQFGLHRERAVADLGRGRVAGAAVDLGVPMAKLLKGSAVAIKELEVPLKEFSTARDLETAATKLDVLNARIDAVQGLEQEVKDAIKARAAAEIGFNRALGKAVGKMGMSLGGAVDPTPLFEAVYYSIRRGAKNITMLRKEAKLMELVTDAAAKEELKTIFAQMRKVARIGIKNEMDEATLLKYVDRVAAERSGGPGAFDAITEEMSAWRKPTPAQVKAERELAAADEELASLRKTREELEAEGRRAGPKTPDGKPDYERVKELDDDLDGLRAYRKDPASGKMAPVEGPLITRAEEALRRAEEAADLARLDPKVIMRRSFNGSKERSAVIAGVLKDNVGELKTPAQELTVDHIVSIKQISEMEGFGKLTVPERNILAKWKNNLIVMDSSANFSKESEAGPNGQQYRTFYNDATRTKIISSARRTCAPSCKTGSPTRCDGGDRRPHHRRPERAA